MAVEIVARTSAVATDIERAGSVTLSAALVSVPALNAAVTGGLTIVVELKSAVPEDAT